jgi:hypothetical protein
VIVSKWLDDDRMVALVPTNYSHILDNKHLPALLKGEKMQDAPEYVKNLIRKLENTKNDLEVPEILFKTSQLKSLNGFVFKGDNYEILNVSKRYATNVPLETSEIEDLGKATLDALKIIDIPGSNGCIMIKKWH